MAVQSQILNKILQTKDASVITLNALTDAYFPEYKDEFNFIVEHLNNYGNVPDEVTFLDKFEHFTIIPKVEESDSYLLTQLFTDKQTRDLAEVYNKLRPLIMSGDKEQIEKANELIRQASEQSTKAIVLNATEIINDTSRYDNYLDMATNVDKYYIKTGFTELDAIIGGWNAKEDVATIVARNGMGKSWILDRCAAAAAIQGKRVGIYSGEMSTDAVAYRIDTLIGGMLNGEGISNGSLVHGNLAIKNEYKNFLSNLNSKVKGELYVLTPKDIGDSAKVSTLRAFIEKYKLDILFVDQHSLLKDDRNAKNPVEKASNISTDLKVLQSIKQIPIVCVCQQNRTKLEGDKEGKKEFDTTQVAQSDKIAQDSSIVIFLERETDLLKLHLVKSRNSDAGKILSYKIDLNTGKFIYIPEENAMTQNIGDYSEEDVF